MADLTITITGVDRLFAKLGRIQGTQILRDPMDRATQRIQKYMAIYPKEKPKSKYVRTVTLGKRWVAPESIEITESSGGLVGKIGNNTEYAPKVQSKKFQTSDHRRTGWRTDADAIRDNRSAIVKDFNASIKEALK